MAELEQVKACLTTLAGQLAEVRETLMGQITATNDPDEAKRLYALLLKVNYQEQTIGSLLFSIGTAQATQHLGAINDATKEIGEAIKDIEQLANVIGAVKNILGIVDGVIDLLT
jgi:hypothetical protein